MYRAYIRQLQHDPVCGIVRAQRIEDSVMIDSATRARLKGAIIECINADQGTLDQLRKEIRPLRGQEQSIRSRATNSISIVGTDGGNNQLRFDPFLIQFVRVVDSNNKRYCLEVISPATPLKTLNNRQFSNDETPQTVLGEMMQFLHVRKLEELSHMIRSTNGEAPTSSGWAQVYRELVEWATLFSILKKDFATDTLIVYDGLLRSKVFAKDLFRRLIQGIKQQIEMKQQKNQCRTYLVGVAKNSKVLTRYQFAMALEEILQTDYPSYVEVPRGIEELAYIWPEFARGEDYASEEGEINKYVGGKMFLVKFGKNRYAPIWPVDIFVSQERDAQIILGSLLADASDGFPITCYPLCLQKAHENAALAGFDFNILEDYIYSGIRASLKDKASALDTFQLQDIDPARQRYG